MKCMHQFLIGIEVPDCEFLPVDLEMGEAIDRLGVGPAFGGLYLVESRAAAAGENERSAQLFEFQMLEVVVVAAEIEVYAVFLEERGIVRNETLGVAVLAIAVDRMMPHADEPRRGARFGQFALEPGEL